MADISVTAAVITASAAVVGATIPQVVYLIQNALQARRDRAERYDSSRREGCVALLRAASDLRTQVANNHDYSGNEMAARLAQVRSYATDAQVHAVAISLLAPRSLAEPAKRLAKAAENLAVTTAADTDLDKGWMVRAPNFKELDACIEAFTADAASSFRPKGRSRGRLARPPGRDGGAKEPDQLR
ncbi:MAG TPA: hypothetical protein VF070_39175 [Streptosporangiaceae bacterium]